MQTKIKGQPRSKRWIRKLIDEGYIKGYDDPRLVTIVALKRRGIQPEAIKEFVLGFGMSNADTVVDISMLLSRNKEIIEKSAEHLYYVPAPVDLKVNEMKPTTVEIKLHPTADLGRENILLIICFISVGKMLLH